MAAAHGGRCTARRSSRRARIPMNTKLNVRLLSCLVGGLLLCVTCVHFVHGYQIRRQARALLDQARRAEQEGDVVRAAEYLHTYLGFEPGDTDALAAYGLALDKQASSSTAARLEAYFALEQVLRREPERHALRRHLVDLAMTLQRFTDAQVHLEFLLQRATPQ